MGAMRMRTDLRPLRSMGEPNSLQRSKSDNRAVSEPNSLVSPNGRLVSISTSEIMTRLAEWKLLRLDLTVLDIGCGIGRIELALAPLVGLITAIDIFPHMIDEVRLRSRDLANVKFHQRNGWDLTAFGDR